MPQDSFNSLIVHAPFDNRSYAEIVKEQTCVSNDLYFVVCRIREMQFETTSSNAVMENTN